MSEKRKTTVREHTVPAVFALHLAQAVQMCGGSESTFLAEVGQTPDQLSDPSARLTMTRFIPLCVRAVELCNEPGLPFVMGAMSPISRFGSLGFAIMASATLGDALQIIERFMPTITEACRYQSTLEDEMVVLELCEAMDLGPARETIVFSISTALWRLSEQLSGTPLPAAMAEFAFPEPAYFARFREFAPGEIRFGASGNRVYFPRSYLAQSLLTADPAAARSARAQCERELREQQAATSLIDQVRAELWDEKTGVHPPRQVARSLGMAERTLKRRLAELGTSYTQILEAARHDRALELLRTQASIEAVAERLGYSDSANFTRAFRRWTGKNPSAFRRDK